ncbi:phosphate ABC transporter ATP-binding protein [Thermus sp.]|uniref:phosphate ABC transporter ATP-binding protein n=1 Tax=Thermus sp. TaxID=275 RepID=UPI0039A5046F
MGLRVRYGERLALGGKEGVSLAIPRHRITALIGPSGCGKTTLLRALNRMHDLNPSARVEGRVLLDGEDIYAPGVDPVRLRRRVGMVFQKPTPFPTLSIYENVVAGLKLAGIADRERLLAAAERALRSAALWEEVRDRLQAPATALSGGQQQRLCIARALAVQPEVLLLDEPTASLDPISAQAIEDLLLNLKREVTLVLVTHSIHQAARVSDYCAFFLRGNWWSLGLPPGCSPIPRTPYPGYLTGRFG